MKTLTTLTAIAALAAGISIASAQTTTKPMSTTAPHASSTMSKSTMGRKVAVTGRSKYCMSGAGGSNSLNCKYASLAACTKAAKPMHRTCKPNPNLGGTTGMKTPIR